ncbi:flocculation protein FLO11-like [Hermetia illucens]|nr:flocculation protein FLO11-like [Hermetia illucens]
MGGGMEYTYEGNSNPYQLWKPPSGYFPRGEAPPPYEEAVALAQAEALSTQCTVSVATTTHRTMPLGLNPNEPMLNEAQPNITTSTTNLINININNGGNITALATGENHQSPYSLASSNLSSNNQPRSTQTHSNCSSSSSSIGEPSNMLTVRSNNHNQSYQLQQAQANSSCVQAATLMTMPSMQGQTQCSNNTALSQMCNSQATNTIVATQSHTYQVPTNNQVSAEVVECTYKNCTLNMKVSGNSRQNRDSSVPNAASASMQQCPTNCNLTGNQECTMSSLSEENRNSSAAILPPPLFDENEMQPEITCVEMIKTPSSMRRYHRTIPRHFTATNTDPMGSHKDKAGISGSNGGSNTLHTQSVTNKKPTCQCPVQHVPMTYMGTSHFNSQHHSQNNMFLSSLSTKLVNNNVASSNAKPSIALPAKNSSHSTSTSKGASKLHTDTSSSFLKTEHSSSGTLRRSNHHSSGSYPNHNGNKIATISRHVVEQRHHDTGQTQQQHSGQVQSILKTPTAKERMHNNHHSNLMKSSVGSEVFNPPFPIQFIDGMSKLNAADSSQHPALPPKMYKSHQPSCSQNGGLKQSNPAYVSKIHTISKPSEAQPVPPRTTSVSRSSGAYSHQLNILSTAPQQYPSSPAYTKSLPRKDDKIHTLTLPPPAGMLNVEKSQSMGKINTTTYYPMQNGHVTYTLPKSSNGKVSLNSTIASVVSKVPSVISIPSPSMSLQTIDNAVQPNQHPTTPTQTIAPTSSSKALLSATTYDTIHKSSVINQPFSSIPPTEKMKSTTLPKSKVTTPTTSAPLTSTFSSKSDEKPLPVCTTSKNCSNPKEHFLPNDTSLDDDYLSECENCKTAHSSRYYLEEEIEEAPQETMTLQRKMDDKEEEPAYYRTSLTLPTNTKKTTTIKNNREQWFSSIPASSSSDEEANE